MSNYYEIQELALYAMGKTEEEVNHILDNEDPDDYIYDYFNVSYSEFSHIVEALLPFTPVIQSALTKTLSHAFVRKDGEYSIAIIKEPVEEPEDE